MPLYEEKFISPLAIRFSQERARPTFQDGRVVSRSLAQIQAVDWPWDEHELYDVLLIAPFPTIEIIRWQPKLRDEDGEKCLDEDGKTIMGESCWFTLDNRRLYCLQAAAARVWPKRAACIVHVMHDLPLSKTCPKKFRTKDLGFSVRLARRNDQFNSRAVWSWKEATGAEGEDGEVKDLSLLGEADQHALKCIETDAAKEEWTQLADVPSDVPAWSGPTEDAAEALETPASSAAWETPTDPNAPPATTSYPSRGRREKYDKAPVQQVAETASLQDKGNQDHSASADGDYYGNDAWPPGMPPMGGGGYPPWGLDPWVHGPAAHQQQLHHLMMAQQAAAREVGMASLRAHLNASARREDIRRAQAAHAALSVQELHSRMARDYGGYGGYGGGAPARRPVPKPKPKPAANNNQFGQQSAHAKAAASAARSTPSSGLASGFGSGIGASSLAASSALGAAATPGPSAAVVSGLGGKPAFTGGLAPPPGGLGTGDEEEEEEGECSQQ